MTRLRNLSVAVLASAMPRAALPAPANRPHRRGDGYLVGGRSAIGNARSTSLHLLFQEADGQIRLHIEHPVAWQGDDLEPMLADMVLAAHLAPVTAGLAAACTTTRLVASYAATVCSP